MKKKHEGDSKKLVLQAERVREATTQDLLAVVGGGNRDCGTSTTTVGPVPSGST